MSLENDDSLFAEEVAEWFLRRGKKDGKLQELAEDAAVFDELKTHLGWRKLSQRVLNQKEVFWKSAAKRLVQRPPSIPTEMETAYLQGYHDCAVFISTYPNLATKNLYAAARAAYVLSQAEGNDQEEED